MRDPEVQLQLRDHRRLQPVGGRWKAVGRILLVVVAVQGGGHVIDVVGALPNLSILHQVPPSV